MSRRRFCLQKGGSRGTNTVPVVSAQFHSLLLCDEVSEPAMGGPMSEVTPRVRLSRPNELVSFCSPSSSHKTIDVSEIHVAVQPATTTTSRYSNARDSRTAAIAHKKLVKSHCHTDARLCFFSLRVINRWNSLSQEIVDAPSVNAFKRHLESVRQNKMGYFMDS